MVSWYNMIIVPYDITNYTIAVQSDDNNMDAVIIQRYHGIQIYYYRYGIINTVNKSKHTNETLLIFALHKHKRQRGWGIHSIQNLRTSHYFSQNYISKFQVKSRSNQKTIKI